MLRREIIPRGDGELTEELRHALDAYVLQGADPDRRPALATAEPVALLAIGFAALTAPLTALDDLAADLPPRCEAIDDALAFAAPLAVAGA
ncbi:hypothetical protein ACGFZP_27520 [Kitasatospora sp. NPDC048239]|uniref:hypothetical protein n=1 Tax=Kitasatospora sp. NPDC048239 TaxID=3364046 RepID=UPI003719117F